MVDALSGRVYSRCMIRIVLALALLGVFACAARADAARMPVDGLTVHYFDCPRHSIGTSCADPENAEIWFAPGSDRFTFWHEVGHVFDYQALTDADRAWLTPRLGFDADRPWWPDDEVSRLMEGDGPGERFADAFALCMLRRTPAGVVKRDGRIVVDWPIAYGYLPTVRQHRRVCNAIEIYRLVRQTNATQ